MTVKKISKPRKVKIASLTKDEVEKLKRLENELGMILVAYETIYKPVYE